MGERILINPETLSHDYIPDKLPRRESIRKKILDNLLDFFESGDSYFSWIIYGHPGVGKTVLARRVAHDLGGFFKENMIITYVNCRYSGKVYRVLIDIVRQVEKSVPERGLSKDDLLNILFQLTAEKTGRILVILDELGALFNDQEGVKTRDMLYSLSRFSEKFIELEKRLQLAVIAIVSKAHEHFFYQWLDRATRASFVKYELNLETYTKSDLFEILSYRADLAFKPGTVSENALEHIASFEASRGGNARIAIDILRDAGKVADKRGDGYLGAEHVREVLQYYLAGIDSEIFDALDKHKLVLLLGIVRGLKELQKSYITRIELEHFYHIVCEEYYEKPRRTTQLLRYLKELGRELQEVIEVEVSGRDQRGRSTRIRVNVPLNDLEKRIIMALDKRL